MENIIDLFLFPAAKVITNARNKNGSRNKNHREETQLPLNLREYLFIISSSAFIRVFHVVTVNAFYEDTLLFWIRTVLVDAQ